MCTYKNLERYRERVKGRWLNKSLFLRVQLVKVPKDLEHIKKEILLNINAPSRRHNHDYSNP